jgi:hypothetical protein
MLPDSAGRGSSVSESLAAGSQQCSASKSATSENW